MSAAPQNTEDLRTWNEALNQTHAMASLRAQAGSVVAKIEARRKRLVCDSVLRHAPSRVVDVGCEDGWIASGYVHAINHLCLADIDKQVLAACPLTGRADVTAVVGDITRPDALSRTLGARGADLIVLSAILEHLPDPGSALRALAPLVAPGGVMVIYVPADKPILFLKQILRRTGLGRFIRGLPLQPAPGHLHVFDRASLAALLRPHGRIVRLQFDPLCLGYLAELRPHPRGGR